MNPLLKATLITIGAVTILVVGIVVYVNGTPSTGGCTPQLFNCPVLLGPNSQAAYADAGIILDAGSDPYVTIQARGFLCSGAIVGPALPTDMEIVDPAQCSSVGSGCNDSTLCVPSPTDGGFDPVKQVTDTCACLSPDAGPCTVPAPDGGVMGAPLGITLQPPFVGAGCIPKECVEVAGKTSWPKECPGL